MASLTFKNLSSVPGLQSSLSSALQNKITPQPLAKPTWQQTLSNQNLPTSYPYQAPSLGDINRQASISAGFTSPASFPTGGMSMNNAVSTPSSTGGMTGAKTSSQADMATGQKQPLAQATPVTPISASNSSQVPATGSGYVNSQGQYVQPSSAGSSANTFPGFINALGNQGNSGYNQSTGTAINQLSNQATNTQDPNNPQASTNYNNAQIAQGNIQGFANNQTPAVVNAEKDYNQFAQSSPYILAAQSNPNVAADVASGRSSLLGQTFAAELGAKQQAVSNTLTGQGQQIDAAEAGGGQALTGQGNQISAANNAGGLAQSGQSTAQNALSAGATAISPSQNGYVLIDKQTGQPVGGNGNSAVTQGAQTDAQYSGALANATDNQAIAGAQNNINSITQLINSAGLNNSAINLKNATIQQLQKNLSNSDYQTLNNGLASIDAALSKVTGAPVDIAQLATSQGTSIIDTINNQVALAKGIAAGKVNSGQNNSQGGTSQSQVQYNSDGSLKSVSF